MSDFSVYVVCIEYVIYIRATFISIQNVKLAHAMSGVVFVLLFGQHQ